MSSNQPELVSSRAYPAKGDSASLAFRIVAWIVVTAFGLLAIFGLLEAVLMWLPDRLVLELVDSLEPSDLEYRVHFHHLGIIAWVVLPALVVQLRHPIRKFAPMLQAWCATIAYLVVMAASGAAEIPDFILPLATSILVTLHPARSQLARRPRLDRWLAWLVIAGIVPLLVRTSDSIAEARNVPSGITAGGESTAGLWANVAIVPLLIVITGLLGSSDYSNWQLPAWTTVAVTIALGLHSIVFHDELASLSIPWAGAIAVWGILYAIAVVVRQSRARAEP